MAAVALAGALLVAPGPAAVRYRLMGRSAVGAGATAGPGRARWLPVIAPAAIGGLIAVVVGGGPGVAAGVLGSGAVFAGCRWLLGGLRRDQKADPLRLAASWDLLAACLGAGLPVPAAVRAIAEELPAGPAEVLRHVARLLALGADPVQAWAPALKHADVAALARGARRTARSGTALAALSSALAAEVRAGVQEGAEARAQRAAVLIAGPLGLCFLPGFLCLGVLPVVVGLASRLVVTW
jgi:Flp pilus assembly protein TadB